MWIPCSSTNGSLCFWVNEELYPSMSIQFLLSGHQRHMRDINRVRAPNIFAKKDPAFRTLHQMDSCPQKVKSKLSWSQKHSTQIFTKKWRISSGNVVCWASTTPPTYYVLCSFTMVKLFAYRVVKSAGISNCRGSSARKQGRSMPTLRMYQKIVSVDSLSYISKARMYKSLKMLRLEIIVTAGYSTSTLASCQ